MNKILLVDVDSKIPNLALMKLSKYYKGKGFDVELQVLKYDYYPKDRDKVIINAEDYSKVFVSIVFTLNKDVIEIINNEDVSYGGTGYDLTIKLPENIERMESDYEIYPENKISYGFLTRGCIRNCYFCFVPKKEGLIRKDQELNDIVKHKQVKFLDNNFLAYSGHKEILKELIKTQLRCQFIQGLDIRLTTEEDAELLSKLNYLGNYIFAFDDLSLKEVIEKKVNMIKKYLNKDWQMKFYIYCHPNMDIKNDILFRVEWCRKNKILPYVMRDISCWDSENRNFYIDLTAYCNQPSLFKKMSFQEFMIKRTKNEVRQKESIALYSK